MSNSMTDSFIDFLLEAGPRKSPSVTGEDLTGETVVGSAPFKAALNLVALAKVATQCKSPGICFKHD